MRAVVVYRPQEEFFQELMCRLLMKVGHVHGYFPLFFRDESQLRAGAERGGCNGRGARRRRGDGWWGFG